MLQYVEAWTTAFASRDAQSMYRMKAGGFHCASSKIRAKGFPPRATQRNEEHRLNTHEYLISAYHTRDPFLCRGFCNGSLH